MGSVALRLVLTGLVLLHGACIPRSPVFSSEELEFVAAAEGGEIAGLEEALRRGVDVNMPAGEYGRTALHVACEKNLDAVVVFLVGHGADVGAADERGEPPIHLAAGAGAVAAVETLLLQGVSVDAGAPDTALYPAIDARDFGMVSHLLSRGASVNVQLPNGWTPLHETVSMDQPGIVRLLLDHGADPTLQGRTWGTALQEAEKLGLQDLVGLLKGHAAAPRDGR